MDSLATQRVKNPPAMQERLGLHPGVGKLPWRREWLPTPVSWPRESPGQRSLAGYSPWDKESDMTEQLSLSLHFSKAKFKGLPENVSYTPSENKSFSNNVIIRILEGYGRNFCKAISSMRLQRNIGMSKTEIHGMK